MPQLDLTDEEAAALLTALNRVIENDRYPLSPRIRVLRGIRANLPGAPHEPPPVGPPRTGRPRRWIPAGAPAALAIGALIHGGALSGSALERKDLAIGKGEPF
jgi:hypothetical protein